MTRTKTPIVISQLEPADFEAVAHVRLLSMEGNPVEDGTYPLARWPDYETRIAHQVHYISANFRNKGIIMFKACIEGTPAGLLVWHLAKDQTETREGTAEVAKKENDGKKTDFERDMESRKDFKFVHKFNSERARLRETIMQNKPHWYLQLLCVHPAYQRLGIGETLVQFATSQADAAGFPFYVESSNPGRRVYEKAGFQVIQWGKVEDESFVGGIETFPVLLRHPHLASILDTP